MVYASISMQDEQIAYSSGQRIQSHLPGEILFWENSSVVHLVRILDGFVKLVKHGIGGRDIIIDICGPEEVLGETSLLQQDPTHNATAVVLTNLKTEWVPFENAHKTVMDDPQHIRILARRLSARLSQSYDNMRDLTTSKANQRVASLLLHFSRPLKNSKNWTLKIPLKRQDIAFMVGITQETTIRIISQFVEQGAILRNGTELIIRDREYLERVIQGDV